MIESSATRHCVVALFAAMEVGQRFPRNEWPAHVTLAGNFVVTATTESLVDALIDADVADGPMVFTFEGCALFGPNRDIPVRLARARRVHALHRRLTDRLGRIPGFAVDEPSHWHDGYRPHLTLRPTFGTFEGESRPASHVALARLTGTESEIVACLPIEGA